MENSEKIGAAQKMYEIRARKVVGDQEWCWIKWRGSFGTGPFMEMTRAVFSELRDKATFSRETRNLYIAADSVPAFEAIIETFAMDFSPFDDTEKVDELDNAFRGL